LSVGLLEGLSVGLLEGLSIGLSEGVTVGLLEVGLAVVGGEVALIERIGVRMAFETSSFVYSSPLPVPSSESQDISSSSVRISTITSSSSSSSDVVDVAAIASCTLLLFPNASKSPK